MIAPSATFGQRVHGLRVVLFCGKGGVGKTTLAAATAIAQSEVAPSLGAPDLLVGTDPACALERVLGARAQGEGPLVPGLVARQLDTDRLHAELRSRHGATLAGIIEGGTYLHPEDALALTHASLPGMDEVLAALELAAAARVHPRIVVDTAPSLHAQRLLASPQAFLAALDVLGAMRDKVRAIAEALGGDPGSSPADQLLASWRDSIERLSELLADPSATGVVVVARAELAAVAEAARLAASLEAFGLCIAAVVANAHDDGAPCCDRGRARHEEARYARAELRRRFPAVDLYEVPSVVPEPIGVAALRSLGRSLLASVPAELDLTVATTRPAPQGLPAPAPRGGETGAAPEHDARRPELPASIRRVGLVVVGGKGGVGKSTLAAAIAIARARAGDRVLVASVGSPGGLSRALDVALGDEPRPVPGVVGLLAAELDASTRFAELKARYRDAVERALGGALVGSRWDIPYDRRIVAGLLDLAPPGVDEVAALAFVVDEDGAHDAVVLDAAPTGHLLRFLDMPRLAREWLALALRLVVRYPELGSAHAIERTVELLRGARRTAERLLDPARTVLVAVALPGKGPREETLALATRTRAMGLVPAVVVVNRIEPPSRCAKCTALRRAQLEGASALVRDLEPQTRPVALAPHRTASADVDWRPDVLVVHEAAEEPRGPASLAALTLVPAGAQA